MSAIATGSIEPDVVVEAPQVTVQTSAFVDDFAAMRYEVHEENISIYFCIGNDDNIHVGFADQSLLNLARLVNEAACAMLRARGIPIPEHIGQAQTDP